jgi:hypothetical protein
MNKINKKSGFLNLGFLVAIIVVIAVAVVAVKMRRNTPATPQTPSQTVAVSPSAPVESDSSATAPTQKEVEEKPSETTTIKNAVTPTPGTTAPVAKTAGTSSKFLTLQFVNQFGVPYATFDLKSSIFTTVSLADSLGEKVPGEFKTTRLGTSYVFDQEIPAGTYTVSWKDSKVVMGSQNGGRSVERHYSAGSQKITVPENGNWFISVPVKQTGITYWMDYNVDAMKTALITFKITNEVGTILPCTDAYHALSDKSVIINNSQGDKTGVGAYEINTQGCYAAIYGVGGLFTWISVEPGKYTIQINKDGYQPKDFDFIIPDASSWTDARVLSEKPAKIDLGKIILKKI